MNKNYMYSLITVIVMFLVAYVGTQGLGFQFLFGVILPYLAFIIFIVGFLNRVFNWAQSAVPFRITTTCGQQRSLNWIKYNAVENPSNGLTVFLRMFLEIFCFRSLFRNTCAKLNNNTKKIGYKLEIFLWFSAVSFHYAFLVVLVRHLRFFTEPIPFFVSVLEKIDSFFRIELLYDTIQVGLPGVFLSGIVLVLATLYLFSRRIFIPQVRYISLFADFFPLFLIIGIALTGILMRYFVKVDIVAVKELTMGLVTLNPSISSNLNGLFYSHIFLVSLLLVYFPFSKLMHMGGVFLSPTRNMTGNTRQVRHINPWNYPVKVHTYEEYEDHFRDKMVDAGLPVDRIPEKQSDGKE